MAEWLIAKADLPPPGCVPGLNPLNLPQPAPPLSFRAVNRRGAPDHDPALQRHHLLPRQLVQRRCFGPLFDEVGRDRVGFDDFRANGLLLPAREAAALKVGLPLHRGPHRDYNAMVLERVGEIEEAWSALRLRAPEVAHAEAVRQLRALQGSLRRRLLDPGRRLRLNRHDPLGAGTSFTAIDAMVESLWAASAPPPDSSAVPPEGGLIVGGGVQNAAVAAASSAFAW